MNFEVFILGTSGMMPLPGRFLTSALLRREGEIFLFDCGEGTQVSLKMLNLKWKKINSIFISHMHADHVTGLPGMLMLSSQVERDTPLYIYGPKKLKEYIDANRRILDMYINYEIVVIPVEPGIILETPEYYVEAFSLEHTKPCVGYSFVEKNRPGEFNPQAATDLAIPCGPLWGKLQKGQAVRLADGREVLPEAVMGKPRGGRKFSYVTDALYREDIAGHVKNADLLLCEGMFEHALLESAVEKKHMTAVQAAMIAQDAQVKKMGLLHYSPRYTDKEIKKLVEEAREIYPKTIHTRDRMSFSIPLPPQ